MLIFKFITIVFCLHMSLGAYTQNDISGSADHSMITRYNGSHINGYEEFDYHLITLPGGEEAGELQYIEVEGKVTRILYVAPEGLSAYQVQKSYLQALQKAGFRVLYEVFGGLTSDGGNVPTEIFTTLNQVGGRENRGAFRGRQHSYFLACFDAPKGAIYVSAHTVLSDDRRFENKPVTTLQIIEEKEMPTEKVTVKISSEMIGDYIKSKGYVRLYGIHFDIDQAAIKESSKTVLKEIADFLTQEPDTRFRVVGHTDDTGDFEYNMKLSERRSIAVIDYLKNNFNITEERLEPYGVSSLAPVSTNDSEKGRALNRRVEFVQIK